MAVYKVIQDVEAEDKLLGPLTLKGFIYAIVAGFLIFLCVKLGISSIGISYKLVGIFILFWPTLLFSVLASPLGREQPTEVWLLSHIRFFIKPKTRLWSQLGQVELVTITAPKKVDRHLVKDLSQNEVYSRLETLATTMDSRGWAIKNVYTDSAAASPPPFTYLNAGQDVSDRLIKRQFPGSSSISDIHPSEDVLDLENSPRAQHVENLLQQKATEQKAKRMALIDNRNQEPSGPAANELQKAAAEPAAPVKPAVLTPQIIKLKNLAQSGSAMTIASIESIASNSNAPEITQIAPGEVEIKLHHNHES